MLGLVIASVAVWAVVRGLGWIVVRLYRRYENALLGVAIWWAVHAWTSLGEVEMSVHGYVAMILGIIFSLLVGCGLMALVFYSNRRGYDEPPDVS